MRAGPIQTETAVQDIGSFSESVRAVFYFFQRKPKKSKGMIFFSEAIMQVLGKSAGPGTRKPVHLFVSLISLCFTGAFWTSLPRSC